MELEIRDLAAEELAAAGGVAGRALSDNPTFRWAAGDQPVPRIGSALDVFVGFMEGMTAPQLGAFLGRPARRRLAHRLRLGAVRHP